jgi:methylitaconate Delta-isomerase
VPGSIVNEVFAGAAAQDLVRIGHPAGIFTLEMRVEERDGQLTLTRSALARTARMIMDGYVYVPRSKVPALAHVAVGAR